METVRADQDVSPTVLVEQSMPLCDPRRPAELVDVTYHEFENPCGESTLWNGAHYLLACKFGHTRLGADGTTVLSQRVYDPPWDASIYLYSGGFMFVPRTPPDDPLGIVLFDLNGDQTAQATIETIARNQVASILVRNDVMSIIRSEFIVPPPAPDAIAGSSWQSFSLDGAALGPKVWASPPGEDVSARAQWANGYYLGLTSRYGGFHAYRVCADGSAADEALLPLTYEMSPGVLSSTPTLLWAGNQFAAAWVQELGYKDDAVAFALFDGNGVLRHAPVFVQLGGSVLLQRSLSVAFDGEKFVVALIGRRPEDQKAFLTLLRFSAEGNAMGCMARLQPPLIDYGMGIQRYFAGNPLLVHNGNEFALTIPTLSVADGVFGPMYRALWRFQLGAPP